MEKELTAVMASFLPKNMDALDLAMLMTNLALAILIIERRHNHV